MLNICFPVKVAPNDCIDEIYTLAIILVRLSSHGEIFGEFRETMLHYVISSFEAVEFLKKLYETFWSILEKELLNQLR